MSGIKRLGLLAPTLLMASACAIQHSSPDGFLPSSEKAQEDAFGAWIDVIYSDGGQHRQATGELIAVGPDSIWVKDATGGVVLPLGAQVSGRVVWYDSDPGKMVGAVLLGMVSTISNGYFLIFTAPLWLIGGSISVRIQGELPIVELPAVPSQLSPYARFPQGMPPGVDLWALKPKG